MIPTPTSPLLVIFGEAYAICALGLLYSRASSRRTGGRRRKKVRTTAAGARAAAAKRGAAAVAAKRGAAAVAAKRGAAAVAAIDAAVDGLAARRGVSRDQLTGDMIDKEFRRAVHKTWSTNLARASRPRAAPLSTTLD